LGRHQAFYEMLHAEISKLALTHLYGIGLSANDKPRTYQPSNTIKGLVTNSNSYNVLYLSPSLLEITIPTSDYNNAMFNDLYFGNIRVTEQCKNLEHLINSDAHPAWVLVTAYYAAYFMVNETSKANGRFVINIEDKDFNQLLSNLSKTQRSTITVENYNSFFVTVDAGQMMGDVTLTLKKSSPKPHQIAWSNFSQIVNKIKIEDQRLKYLSLLKSILSPDTDAWKNPSVIRNNWNYAQANYFGEKGLTEGSLFNTLIKSETSTYGWAKNNNLKPSVENLAASISFIYYILKAAQAEIIKRLHI